MPWKKPSGSNPEMLERGVAGVCYLTGGLAGLLYIIISRSSYQSMFFRFHFLQSIVISILGVLLNLTSGILTNILGGMFGVFGAHAIASQVQSGVAITMMVIFNGGFLLLLYGMIFAFMGKLAEIPVISPLVRQNMNR